MAAADPSATTVCEDAGGDEARRRREQILDEKVLGGLGAEGPVHPLGCRPLSTYLIWLAPGVLRWPDRFREPAGIPGPGEYRGSRTDEGI